MKEKIINILARACALPEEINESTELATLSIDSLSFVGAVVELESEFGVQFEPEELDLFGWLTAGDVVRAVEEKCEKRF
jgi:acyl carrier protein